MIVKKILISFSLLLAGTLASGQTGTFFGIEGGLNCVWISNQNTYGEPELDYLLKISPRVSVIAGHMFTEKIGLRTEIGWARMGQKYYGKQYLRPAERYILMDYLQVPALVKFIAGKQRTKLYLLGGPQLCLLVHADQTYTRDGANAPPFYNTEINQWIDVSKNNITSRYRKFDVMIRLDLGAHFRIKEKKFIDLGITAAYGLIDLNKKEWRLDNIQHTYGRSHSFYSGLTLCFLF